MRMRILHPHICPSLDELDLFDPHPHPHRHPLPHPRPFCILVICIPFHSHPHPNPYPPQPGHTVHIHIHHARSRGKMLLYCTVDPLKARFLARLDLVLLSKLQSVSSPVTAHALMTRILGILYSTHTENPSAEVTPRGEPRKLADQSIMDL